MSKRKFQGSSKDPVRFKYAFCNESMQGMSWGEQCDLVARSGYQGIEIAPFSLVRESVEELVPARRGKLIRALKDAGLECAGLHWLLSPPPPDLHVTTPDPEVRKKSWSYFEKLIDLCGDLGGPVMVFGSPKGRSSIGGLSAAEAKKYLAEGLAGVADHAQRRGVKILLESLGQNQTDVVNTLAEAVEILEQIAHPAIQTMFDFHNTTAETEPFPNLIEKYFSRIHHVHVQEMDGRHLGSGNAEKEFLSSFRKLRDLRFDKWISVEVFDFSPGAETLAVESLKTLRAIEKKLT
ncbi:MAG: sugar phosphate isomerase/epimerase [Deltaproteobacteria bacterium]|nr:MAG: sugar phosphate isomerase/epimerase [Deltaproteobacteria bacterium]